MQEHVFPPFNAESSSDDARIARLLATYQQAVEDRLDRGLVAIQQASATLMHEIASEMWRAAGGDAEATRSQILTELTRDQAIRGLIAHTDERMQSLTVRYAHLEDTLTGIAQSNRTLKDVMSRAAQTLLDVANSPAMAGVRDVHDLLTRVEQNLSATFELLDERDRLLTEQIREQIRDHDGTLAEETARIVEALEGYVTSGVDAMGRLAQHVQEQVQLSGMHDTRLAERLMAEVNAQLELMYERITLEAREMAKVLQARQAPIRDVGQHLADVIELRTRGLAELTRSDAQVLRRQIEEATRRVTEATSQALAGLLDERLDEPRATAAATAETLLAIGAGIDKLDESMGRMRSDIERSGTEAKEAGERSAAVARESSERAAHAVEEAAERAGAQMRDALAGEMEQRIGALARMIRSDNQALAQAVTAAAEQEAAKQALRAVKELQSGLPTQIADELERRFASFAEQLRRESMATMDAMARSNEVLARKIEQMGERMGTRYEEDMSEVIGSLGSALAQVGRRAGGGGRSDRIELE